VEFAVAAIDRWWMKLGKARPREPKRLLFTGDSGGSHSPRTRLWRVRNKDADAIHRGNARQEILHKPTDDEGQDGFDTADKYLCEISGLAAARFAISICGSAPPGTSTAVVSTFSWAPIVTL